MERQNRVGRRCNDEDEMRAVFLSSKTNLKRNFTVAHV